jgi:hypothetical protein
VRIVRFSPLVVLLLSMLLGAAVIVADVTDADLIDDPIASTATTESVAAQPTPWPTPLLFPTVDVSDPDRGRSPRRPSTPASRSTPVATASPAPPAATETVRPPAPTAVPTIPPVVRQVIAEHQRNLQRAQLCYTALQDTFYIPDMWLYREQYPLVDANPYAFLWPLGQAMAATNDMASLPVVGDRYLQDVQQMISVVEQYWDEREPVPGYASYIPPPIGWQSDRYYDDNVWIGLELVRAYELTGNEHALLRAQQVFDYMVSGWDHDQEKPAPGGILWNEASWNQDRNTVSTAPTIELGLQLALLTDDLAMQIYYTTWAREMYHWVETYMRDANSLYWDRITPEGWIDTSLNTYNQGAMIGANVWFYYVTGDPWHLDRAEQIAQAALAVYGDGDIASRPIAHNAIFFQRLMLLYEHRPRPEYLQFLQSYANGMWRTTVDPDTGLFVALHPTGLLEQGATVQFQAMIARYGTDEWFARQ